MQQESAHTLTDTRCPERARASATGSAAVFARHARERISDVPESASREDRPTRAVPDGTVPGPGAPAATRSGGGGHSEEGHRNEVVVAGRITSEPVLRDLPSGDRIATWRICVARSADSGFRGRRVDSITCVSFDRVLHGRIGDWCAGDVVQVSGALRRRTWQGRSGIRSVCEVEVRTAELLRPGPGGRSRAATPEAGG